MDKTSELKFTISRFDHYYDSVNNKGNLYLTLNTFLLGGLIAGYAALLSSHVCTLAWPELVIIGLIAGCNIFAFYHAVHAIYPFVSKRLGSSSIFFGDIAGRTESEWRNFFAAVQPDAYEQDLLHQAHQLASGLLSKYLRLRTSTWWIFAQFVLFILGAFYLLIKHYK
jgi:hypothetical protein